MHLTTLEYPKILETLASYAMFSASKELALALEPTPYRTEADTRQTETREAVKLLSVKADVSIGGARDVRSMTQRTERGMILLAEELGQVQQTLIAARDLQRILSKLAVDYPRLADIAQRIEPCPGVINDINQAIDERGEIRSTASPTLARIRREIQIVHGRLMEKLNRLVASPAHRQHLQEPIVTQRDGRYVVPLKAGFKGKLKGIIHDQSSSGQTLFIEPMMTVELNNQWRQLQLDETEEIQRILAALSAEVAAHAEAIRHTVEALAELDLAFAKAKYAIAIEATQPDLFEPNAQPSPSFNLIDARHPLLDSQTVVPIDVALPDQSHILVITGPNTGGKTVSLKTIGLLTMMAQAGLWIPAGEGSSLPVFNNIFADIGDEQSIEQNLSTFSGHMTNIVRILQACDDRSLVIFDELGSGTDPIEGAALARAILSHLLERGVTTFVATHYSELKAYAHGTSGVANASMEFDLDSLAPTYRLLIGLPGASNAFTISQRLGLPQDIINQARGLVGDDAKQIEAMLAEIKAQTEAAERLKQQAEQRNQQLQERLKNIHEEKKDILSSARADARDEIKAARQQIREMQQQAETALKTAQQKAEDVSQNLTQADENLESLTSQIEAKERPASTKKAVPVRPRGIKAGDTVFIISFGTTGEVVSIQNKQVEVQMGHFRTSVPLAQVELRKKGKAQPTAEPTRHNIKLPTIESPGMELDLRGQLAGEAVQTLDGYLDKAYMARLPWVRIVHGKGSGALRHAVRKALNKHALISNHRPGESGEGGDGVTVAKLAVT